MGQATPAFVFFNFQHTANHRALRMLKQLKFLLIDMLRETEVHRCQMACPRMFTSAAKGRTQARTPRPFTGHFKFVTQFKQKQEGRSMTTESRTMLGFV